MEIEKLAAEYARCQFKYEELVRQSARDSSYRLAKLTELAKVAVDAALARLEQGALNANPR